jgi:AraC family transcriptional regulator of adaptative response/methylated-DNA-[protein]-cysteine methyltransferase
MPHGIHAEIPGEAEMYWRAVRTREQRLDGTFVYAVRSTGIYCLPSCPSRKPKRENTAFYHSPEHAEEAGFRPCLRCKPRERPAEDPHVRLVREASRFIEANTHEPLMLTSLSTRFGLSPHHLQRTFKAITGVTPQAYLDACRMHQVRTTLQAAGDIHASLYDAGYGSISRLYERAAKHLGMTPGQYRQKGRGMQITYTTTPCHLGHLLFAATPRGICAVRLGDAPDMLEAELQAEFSGATLERNDEALRAWVEEVLRRAEGKRPHLELPLDVQATAFQRQVWQALQEIPHGETRSYAQVAQAIGKPSAVRAVASACASNRVALLIPCHRVVRTGGDLSGYRWGVERKAALLEHERGDSPERS